MFPGDENSLLLTAGLDPLTPKQLRRIKPLWKNIVLGLAEMPNEVLNDVLAFANRMKNDEDFSRHWVMIT